MKRFVRFAAPLALMSMPGLADSWSGFLVDAECYATEHTNTKAGIPPASIDNNQIVRMCVPKETTNSFAIVRRDGTSLKLDEGGNQKARDLISKQSNTSQRVAVTGTKEGNTVKVSTIGPAK